LNMVIAIYLLPCWWQRLAGGDSEAAGAGDPRPPLFYRAFAWRIGLRLARLVPQRLARAVGRTSIHVYWRIAPKRRTVVIENLAAALTDDRQAAKAAAMHLFDNFAIKVVDLLRSEAGLESGGDLGEATGWEYFKVAREGYRGVLLLTPHLGNWEFGARFLRREGINLNVVTLSEPGSNFTELRRSARARSNIETLVIGHDPFAFVEIIRRLQEGATVALLVDRPPKATATTVELFGRPFAASVAAAELARASGCALLPFVVLWTGRDYSAHLFPPIAYDRGGLRNRQERQRLTNDVMRFFEPLIRRHVDQWYHFVPVWPQPASEPEASPMEKRCETPQIPEG